MGVVALGVGTLFAIKGAFDSHYAGQRARRAEKRAQTAQAEAKTYREKTGGVADAMSDEFRNQALPLYQQERDRIFSKEYEAEQRQLAEGTYRRGVEIAGQSRRRSALSMGMRPEDVVTQGEGTSARMATGLAEAQNRTGMAIRGARMNALRPGLTMGGQSANINLGAAGSALGSGALDVQMAGVHTQQQQAANQQMWRGAEMGLQAGGDIMGSAGNIWGGDGGGNYVNQQGYTGSGQYAGFAEGGLVEGPGTGTSDSVPAMIDGQQPAALSDGEYVLPADVTRYYGIKKLYDFETKAREDMASGMQGGTARRTGGEPQQQEGGARRMAAQPQIAA